MKIIIMIKAIIFNFSKLVEFEQRKKKEETLCTSSACIIKIKMKTLSFRNYPSFYAFHSLTLFNKTINIYCFSFQ